MDIHRDQTSKRLIRIRESSGCFIADYNSISSNEESIIVLLEENNENSGSFKFPIINNIRN